MAKEQIIGILDKNKVYSSYYAKACKILPNRRLVAISIGIPDGFSGEIMRELNPSGLLLSKYKNNEIDSTEYEKVYIAEVLSRLEANEIYNRLKGKCIICYCGKDKFCHRHLVINWLIDKVGQEVFGGEL